MDIQLTTKSNEALGAAVRIASAHGNPQVEPLHLLDSLLQQGEGIATALLDAVGADVPALTAQVRADLRALPSASGSSDVHVNGGASPSPILAAAVTRASGCACLRAQRRERAPTRRRSRKTPRRYVAPPQSRTPPVEVSFSLCT